MNVTKFQSLIVILVLLLLLVNLVSTSRPTRREFRKMQKTISLIKKALDRKADELEMQELEIKVDDLINELTQERNRVDILERYLNASVTDIQSIDLDMTSTKTIENDNKERDRKLEQLMQEMKLLKRKNGKLKTRVDSMGQALNKVKTVQKDSADITNKLEEVIMNATKTNEDLKDIKVDTANLKRKAISRASKNEVSAAVVRKAFRDEKMDLHSFKQRLETQVEDVLEAVNGSRKSEMLGVDMEAVIANLSQQIKFELNASREQSQELNTAVWMIKMDVAMLEGKMNSTEGNLEELQASHQERIAILETVNGSWESETWKLMMKRDLAVLDSKMTNTACKLDGLVAVFHHELSDGQIGASREAKPDVHLPVGRNGGIDLYLLVDARIGDDEYFYMNQFIKLLLPKLRIGRDENGTRLSLYYFGSEMKELFNQHMTYTGVERFEDYRAAQRAIDSGIASRYLGSNGSEGVLNKVLKDILVYEKTRTFYNRHGYNTRIPRVVLIVFSEGVHTCKTLGEEAAAELKAEYGATIYTIALGCWHGIKTIASDEHHFFRLDSYRDVNQVINAMIDPSDEEELDVGRYARG